MINRFILGANKGFKYVVEALRLVKSDVCVGVFGDSDFSFDGLLKACAISNVIKNKIKIVAFGGGRFSSQEILNINEFGFKDGFVQQVGGNDEVLASLYANALCFLYPSLYEGFGLPSLEAMAAECPVVSSNTSSMPEVVNQAGVYFDPNNTDEMCSAIERVVEDEALRLNLIQLGLENIKLFSWQKCATETLEIYKKMTGKALKNAL